MLALWREALLAQKVLSGETRGYKHHPQLKRFKAQADAPGATATYLHAAHNEAVARGYHFNKERLQRAELPIRVTCTHGQLVYEWEHLKPKLKQRDRARYEALSALGLPQPHPMFEVVAGEVEDWEVGRQ